MILTAHLAGAACQEVGEEIWQVPLQEAIRAEAEMIAEHAGPELLVPVKGDRGALKERIVAEMRAALVKVGDRYRAPDGVLYTLEEAPAAAPADPVKVGGTKPVVTEVLRFDPLRVGPPASRRAVVRWSDGAEGEALRWYSDEVLICEGDLLGRTRAELRALHFRRDRDRLRS
jgi:hypothetical protein